jgi:predicted transcriptional regulator YheO
MDWSVILSSTIVAGTTIIGIILKEYLQKNKTKKNLCVVKYTKKNQNIQRAIEYTLEKSDADRAYIYEFHNGETFYSGTHQQKFSCTYETLNIGVSAESMKLQGLRVSTFHDFIKDVLGVTNGTYFKLESIDDIQNPLIKNWMEERGIQSSFAFPIKTLNDGIVGMLCIDFTKKKSKLNKDQIHLLQNQSIIIGGYLI